MAGEDKQDGEIKNGTQKAKVASVGDSDQGDLGYSNEGLASAVGDQNHGSLEAPVRSSDKVAQEGGQVGEMEAAVKIAEPQAVENSVPPARFTSPASVSEKPVSRHLVLVKSDVESDVKKPLHTGGNELHTGVKVENTPLTRRETLKWHVEWKTTSRNVRELVYRLKWLDGATWKPVTRQMVERGEINVQGSLIRSLHKFKTHEAERVERLGKDAVRRFVRAVIERNRLRRTG